MLFVCVKNAGKSQLAAALARQHDGDAMRVLSAGTSPGQHLNAESAAVLEEVGASTDGESPSRSTHRPLPTQTSSSSSARKPHSTPAARPSNGGSPTGPRLVASTAPAGSESHSLVAVHDPAPAGLCKVEGPPAVMRSIVVRRRSCKVQSVPSRPLARCSTRQAAK